MGAVADAIREGVVGCWPSVPLPPHTCEAVFDREAELVWNDPWTFNIGSLSYTLEGRWVVSCAPVYGMGTVEYRETCGRIRSKIGRIGRALGLDGMSEVEKAEAVHGYVASSLVWDDSRPDQHDLRCLLAGRGVCDGLAKCAAAILAEHGVECLVVTGRLNSSDPGPGHAWNLVRVGGRYYHLDSKFSVSEDARTHYYCLVDDRTMAKQRTWSSPVPCMSMSQNYYYRRGHVASGRPSLARLLHSWPSDTRVEVLMDFKFDAGDVYRTVYEAEREGADLPSGEMYIYRNVLVIERERPLHVVLNGSGPCARSLGCGSS